MSKLGVHSFVWTGSSARNDIEEALRKTQQLGYKLIEFPTLDPEEFDIRWLRQRLEELDLTIAVTPWAYLSMEMSPVRIPLSLNGGKRSSTAR
jgi:sugar phosphate isomerase/epimerase